ncbi:hypothetical protein A2630_04070 [Candidatus Woesebacteria bacterium RIFCSPHIGHO2_01_FULL_44_10]|uniref:Uncharacterized protein n=1 Tax=Candidatus Woesebacteria bacterium RIFCSPLOWO2_01_FULL_44_14 TaxID=1802525 RepID=A0A1F8C089_9BACT|nr:MAG: hypothetical protein A2630_04070 [Candidatus Woesebacteria bacterium RIFCSPHIGHO2_01_FULL_44_10]OGM56387.1 MAG: hypothetical protein A3F62_04760 [Candidatus Woesebacteria bacterium RIFCSPHIGHO2_12_FULL_44_11]OGM69747.1 MAG: hypothetical protein A2975_02770 [Candidatus Woesebacteria bacterium RIFCSPLOWO2_01_FULL_44_14]
MHIKLTSSQYKLLSRYFEDLSKALVLYNVIGYFLPSILPTTIRPSGSQLILGAFASLTVLALALILERGGEQK